jgi:hypothetical protein
MARTKQTTHVGKNAAKLKVQKVIFVDAEKTNEELHSKPTFHASDLSIIMVERKQPRKDFIDLTRDENTLSISSSISKGKKGNPIVVEDKEKGEDLDKKKRKFIEELD